MTSISIVFIILKILIIGLGIFIGCRRGVGKSAVRLVYLCLVGALTAVIARPISSSVAAPLYGFIINAIPAEYSDIIISISSAEVLGTSILAALINLFVFSTVFAVLELLTLICFERLAGAIVRLIAKDRKIKEWGGLFGAIIGLITAIMTSAFLLCPLYFAVEVIDTVPPETIEVFIDAYSDNTEQGAIESKDAPIENQITPSFKTSRFFPVSKLVTDKVCSFTIPETEQKDKLSDLVPATVELAADMLYVHNSSVYAEETVNVVINNVVATLDLHLETSPTIKFIAAHAVSAVGEELKEDGEFMGMYIQETDSLIVNSLTEAALNAVASTTPETVMENLELVFGAVDSRHLPPHKRQDFEKHFPKTGYDGKAKKGLLLTILEFEYESASDLTDNSHLQDIIDGLAGIFGGDDQETTEIHGISIPKSVMDEIISHVGTEVSPTELRDYLASLGYEISAEQAKELIDQYE